MYWIYFLLFLFAAATPGAVRGGAFGLSEEAAETVVVLLFGSVGFLLFLAKQKSLLRHLREKLNLQREKTVISKDLSDSYSYIGEANRKIDLLKGLILSLPDAALRFRNGEVRAAYGSFEKAVVTACKSPSFLVRIVDAGRKEVDKELRVGKCASCLSVPVETLLASTKSLSEESGCVVVRSKEIVGGRVAFLVFPKQVNWFDDSGLLETLATQALVLYLLERDAASRAERKTGS